MQGASSSIQLVVTLLFWSTLW